MGGGRPKLALTPVRRGGRCGAMRVKYLGMGPELTEGKVRLGLARVRGMLKRGWCQRLAAVDEHGSPVSFSSRRAVAWCLSGACSAAAIVDDEYDVRLRDVMGYAVQAAIDVWPGAKLLSAPDWNDRQGRTQAEVVTLLEQAETFVGVVI